MAEFIEESVNEEDNFSDITQQEPVQEQEEVVQEQVDDDLPEKYRGKDLKEIARMHQEAERLIGRQGSEVGELRKIVDDFIKAQTSTTQQKQDDVTDDDYFANPTEAVTKLINNHPKIKEAEQASLQMKQAETISRLKEKHPDFMDIASNSSFQEWVAASKVRTQLFASANAYDFDAADELLSIWKERSEVAKATLSAEKDDRKRQIKTATAVAAKGSDEAPSKKIYRRADIIKLMQNDPDRYDAMQDEIMAAYREGRVK